MKIADLDVVSVIRVHSKAEVMDSPHEEWVSVVDFRAALNKAVEDALKAAGVEIES